MPIWLGSKMIPNHPERALALARGVCQLAQASPIHAKHISTPIGVWRRTCASVMQQKRARRKRLPLPLCPPASYLFITKLWRRGRRGWFLLAGQESLAFSQTACLFLPKTRGPRAPC